MLLLRFWLASKRPLRKGRKADADKLVVDDNSGKGEFLNSCYLCLCVAHGFINFYFICKVLQF